MANMPSVAEATFLTHYNPAAEVPGGDYFDLSILNDFDDFSGFVSERNIKPGPIPVPKPEPEVFLPDLETNLPPGFSWYPPGPMAAYQPPNQELQLSQPPTPAAECQVSSTMSPIGGVPSPYGPHSPQSIESLGDDNFLQEINLKGLTEEQLVSLTARDLNRLCRDVPEDVIKQLKKRRRTLKNRGYAYNSRVRRVSQKNQLEEERDDLKQQLQQMRERCRMLEREAEQWKRRADALARGEV